jgi:membrane-bound lytic murein transglycosylase D
MAEAGSGADPAYFPHYPEIHANVTFWEHVYGRYSSSMAVIHDQTDLDRIYRVIKLNPQKTSAARKSNRALIEKTKDHYAAILTSLAGHNRPRTSEEKRVAALFDANASSSHYLEAAQNIRAQTGIKEEFRLGVIRSGAYMANIKQIFRSYGLPEDLAYLPHVESSFNVDAYSKFGAAGAWQFTRETGSQYMRIDYIIDERRDPLIAADGAARFLKKNYEQLGSWPLAITAYNYGPAGMRRAVAEYGSYERIFAHYRKGHFKFASRNFYAEFLAAVRVAKMYEQSGQLRLDQPRSYFIFRTPGYTKAVNLMRYLQIDEPTMRRYNPALRDPVFDGTKYIPKGYALKFPSQPQISNALRNPPASLFSGAQKASRFYRVQPGDTAGAIAKKHGIPLQTLLAINHLGKNGFIQAGQNLRIPSASGSDEDLVVLNDNKKYATQRPQSAATGDIVVAGNLQVMNPRRHNGATTGEVEVQPDESLGVFARWLGNSAESVGRTNGLAADEEVVPGQQLTLVFTTVDPQTFEQQRFDFHREIQEDFFASYAIVGFDSYTVRKGDTLWSICYKVFNLPLWLMKKYNADIGFTTLKPATRLLVPQVEPL